MAAQIMGTSTVQDDLSAERTVAPVGNATDQRQCTRCGGLMVAERYIDLLDDTGQLEFTGERCISCGEVVDQTILRNRLANQARTPRVPLAQVA